MYLVGKAHPNKDRALSTLRQLTEQNRRLVTSTEVFQEICHRYVALGKREAILPCFEALSAVVDEVFPIDMETIKHAHLILLAQPKLSARDAIHVASMKCHGVEVLLSFDTDFDQVPGIQRVS